ncbi:hypothetical protein IAR50_003172 [Cryptococcus sp. DSM 104548]
MIDQHMQDDSDVHQIDTTITTTHTFRPSANGDFALPQETDREGHTQLGLQEEPSLQPKNPHPPNLTLPEPRLLSPLSSLVHTGAPLPGFDDFMGGVPPSSVSDEASRAGERTGLGGLGPLSETPSSPVLVRRQTAYWSREQSYEEDEERVESRAGPDRSSRDRRNRQHFNLPVRRPRRAQNFTPRAVPGLQLQLDPPAPTVHDELKLPSPHTRRGAAFNQQTHLGVLTSDLAPNSTARYHPYSQPSTPFTPSFPSTSTPTRSQAPQTPITPSTPSLSTSSPITPSTPASLLRRRGLSQGDVLKEARGERDEMMAIRSSISPGRGGRGYMRRGSARGLESSPGIRMTSMDFGAPILRRPSTAATSQLPQVGSACESPSRSRTQESSALSATLPSRGMDDDSEMRSGEREEVGGQEKVMEEEDSEMGVDASTRRPLFNKDPFGSQATAQPVQYPPSPRSRPLRVENDGDGDSEEAERSTEMMSNLNI